MKKFSRLISALACMFIMSTANAQNNTDSVTWNGKASPTAVPFLRMNTDIRSAGIGESGVALPGDNVTHYANAARMAQIESKGAVAVAYTPWMSNLAKNIALYAASGHYKFNEREVFSASLRYFKQGKLLQTDEYGQSVGESNPYDLAVDVSYARKLSNRFSIGAAFRYINSHIANNSYAGYKNGNAVAADLGVYYQSKENAQGQSWHAGAALTNVGTKIKYGEDNSSYKLPSNFALGVAFQQKWEELHQVILTTEVNKPLVKSYVDGFGKNIVYNVGGEYAYRKMLALRAGYNYENTAVGGLRYVTTGLGVYYKILRFDLAYLIPTQDGANATISNTFKFGFSFLIQ
ncbi:hypothetical protein LX64_01676 [Chitinophaga skermanii]|uniref:Type IX secretion system protein PorV domain-containing protein n=1 Tax=Chitinophaga skermanii TaxID=331697 RepID=A0A327QPP3_9BACT|nr:PorV/PorQ family protein [Chitinophaga skermanii]RAJ06549.1 hypothetical protein LX64_01676 [Chitinophaga skermanii]